MPRPLQLGNDDHVYRGLRVSGLMAIPRMSRRVFLFFACVTALIVACTGPETLDDVDSTPTPAPEETSAPAAETTPATEPTEQAVEPTETPTEEPEPTETPEPTPTVTPSPSPTPTHLPVGMNEGLPQVEELPVGEFTVANQGSRAAVDLANAYQDSASHLERLNEWGFQEHVFREFTHQRTVPEEDPSPAYFLATINEYGSPEQAGMFFEWWSEFAHLQGHSEIEPPDIGDNAFASTVPTAEGEPTAFLYVQRGSRVFAYYAEEGNPVEFVTQVATTVFERINTPAE